MKDKAFIFFRASTAILLLIHGVVRMSANAVIPFGDFLNHVGFPFGNVLAWSITLFEIVGGVLLAIGIYTRYVALAFFIELLLGIILVHAKFGWFVVGHGSNGVEYSICLMNALSYIFFIDYKKLK